MKALMLQGKEKAEYLETPTPECPRDGYLLKMISVGLCGSDVRTYTHGHHKLTYPHILGHENVGEIVEVGPDALEKFKVGDKVFVSPGVYCGKCYYCTRGHQNMCDEVIVYGTTIQGGMAEYMPVVRESIETENYLIKIPDGTSEEVMDEIILAEMLSSIVTCHENIKTSLGQTVVILGQGPAGLLHAEIARLRGAKNIICADTNVEHLEFSKKRSATHIVDNKIKGELERVVNELTDGIGADIAIVAAPVKEIHNQALELVKKQGIMVIYGGINKDAPMTSLNANTIHYKEARVYGAFATTPRHFKEAFDLIVSGKINKGLITHRLHLKDMEKGVDLVRSGKAIKVVLKP